MMDGGPPGGTGASDAMLVARAKTGDVDAFALLYRRYLNQVYDFVARRLESREAAQDATQTIFMRALASIGQCRDETRFAGWLFAIARNAITDSYRTRHPASSLDESTDIEDLAESPEDHAIRADQGRFLRELRDRCLTQTERDLLDMRLQELGDREIAAALGRSHGAIRNAQYRMIQKLRDCLGLPAGRKGDSHAPA